jgi:hypothetical protein
MRRALVLAVCLGSAALPALVSAARLPGAPRCTVFPANNPWNQKVNRLPVARHSARYIAAIGLDDPVQAGFGAAYDGVPNGIPFIVVSGRTRRVRVRFVQDPAQSSPGPYPIPADAPIEGGPSSTGDRHVIVVDRATCKDYELFDAYPHDGGRYWTADTGAIFNLRSDKLRPAGWTSADAAGLPILPGLALYSQVRRGAIDHALRFTAECTGRRYVYPARQDAPNCGDRNAPPMGLRLRLKASVDISHLPYQARVVARALKTYGMILADNGQPWVVSGAPNQHWNNNALGELDQLTGRDFQVVDTSSLPHPGL